jgi:hypothetical protein
MAAPPPRWLQRQLAAVTAAGGDVTRLRAGGLPGAPADRFCAALPFCGGSVTCAPPPPLAALRVAPPLTPGVQGRCC